MKLDSIARKLQTDGLGTIGKEIFIDNMPAKATSGILLRSALLGSPIDYELPGYRNTHFNVATRGKTHKAGEELMARVMLALTLGETKLTGMAIQHMRPRTDPVAFPLSEATIFEFLVIFEVVYVIVD